MKIATSLTGSEQVRALMARLSPARVARALAATAEDTEDLVRDGAMAHSKSGRLVRSLERVQEGSGWVIRHDPQHAPHALFVHWGTRPHEIRPRNKRALRYARNGIFWFWFGPQGPDQRRAIKAWVEREAGPDARVMFRWPKHPGYKGDPWMVRAARQAPAIFAQHLARQINSST